MNQLAISFAQLKPAQAKFKSCIENAGEVKPQNTGMTIIVPLTGSLYVSVHLSDAENVIVDLRTLRETIHTEEAREYEPPHQCSAS